MSRTLVLPLPQSKLRTASFGLAVTLFESVLIVVVWVSMPFWQGWPYWPKAPPPSTITVNSTDAAVFAKQEIVIEQIYSKNGAAERFDVTASNGVVRRRLIGRRELYATASPTVACV